MSKSKYQPYAQYKPSQSEWLDKVPEKWEEKRLKFLISQKITDGPHETPKFISEGVPFLSVDGIQNDRLVFENCRFISQENHTQYKLKCFPRKGDILLGKAASVGKVAIVDVDFEFNVWSPLALIRANKKILSKYIYYSFKANTLQDQVSIRSTSNTQHNLSMDDIPELWLTFPSVENQKVIIAFLDCETAKIDQIIDKNNRLVKLLQEQRQAIITRAVTKGLDPHAHLKFSGIDWLGDIPENWEVKRLNYLISNIVDKATNSQKSDFIVALENIEGWTGNFLLPDDQKMPEGDLKRFSKGDVLFGKLRPYLAKVFLAEQNGLCVGEALVFRTKRKLLNKFLAYRILTKDFINYIDSSTQGAKMPRAEWEFIKTLFISYPSSEEQQKIIKYIDHKTAKIDEIVKKVKTENQKLQEYRQALISNAVTGKIQV